jgi:hypothetical protein
MLRHAFIAGLLATGLMTVLFLGGRLFPPQIWVVALYPGMILAEALLSVLPASSIDMLKGGLGADEAPALYVSMSVVCAFLFWWLFAFTGIKVRAHLQKNKGMGRMPAASRLR